MTHGPLPKEPLPIRLVFKLERAEHPRLYDELIRFRKGAKRVSRLRLLAYDGLLVQQGLLKLPGQTLSGTPGSIGFDGDAAGRRAARMLRATKSRGRGLRRGFRGRAFRSERRRAPRLRVVEPAVVFDDLELPRTQFLADFLDARLAAGDHVDHHRCKLLARREGARQRRAPPCP